ncbi:hypothetical protein [Sulfurimonas sp. HSL-1716]|uniref:hypothetical protein n=1 Tax=Hydrocurvibacter sulfurireducens TaxID=3131937 RepID=UPI0031F9A05F
MTKRFVASIILIHSLLLAGSLKVGDTISPSLFKSQFEKKISVADKNILIITWERSTTDDVNSFISKNLSFIKKQKTSIIIDVSTIPHFIFSSFVMPKLQKYSYEVLLNYDKRFEKSFPHRKNRITLLCLKESIIQKIFFEKSSKRVAEDMLTCKRYQKAKSRFIHF